jgi:hypothetical protein
MAARDAYMPARPNTRDGRYIWEAIKLACKADLNDQFAISERDTSYSVEALGQEEDVAPNATNDFKVHVDEDRRVWFVPMKSMTPELTAAWLEFHPIWVAAELPVVVARAIERLRAIKRARRSSLRRERRNSWRKPVLKPGRKPTLAVPKKSFGNSFLRRKII